MPQTPAEYSAKADEIRENPQFQSAYEDATVASRTQADRKLAGMTPEQIAEAKAKDAAWNAKQAEYDKANPVGSKDPGITKPEGATVPYSAPAGISPERSAEILANLKEGKRNSPQLFSDYATFRNSYGYDAKPEAEKAKLDEFWRSN